jgi:alkanesulfonate monooxygenase SsuD/methylene tetrahydromethanopterin reductase-like flavin-dependent oxidoreductase (luciferase family)
MKIGIQLHPDRGADAVLAEARAADEQGYDSVWLSDHLFSPSGVHTAEGPLDSFTLMTAVGATTQRVRLAWAMLNISFRYPAVLAKMLATLDVITHGRVICTLGSGWFKEEYEAYDLPLIDDHDARAAYAREVVALIKTLWTHAAPERISFIGDHVRARELPFNPAPYQKPHPPIWFGGDSDATLTTVKEFCDGWVMARSGNPETLARVLSAPDWPRRPMTLARSARIFVAEGREAALAEARVEHNALLAGPQAASAGTFEEFAAREITGTPAECVARIAEIGSWGINYLRVNFRNVEAQERTARLLLPRLAEVAAVA